MLKYALFHFCHSAFSPWAISNFEAALKIAQSLLSIFFLYSILSIYQINKIILYVMKQQWFWPVCTDIHAGVSLHCALRWIFWQHISLCKVKRNLVCSKIGKKSLLQHLEPPRIVVNHLNTNRLLKDTSLELSDTSNTTEAPFLQRKEGLQR